MQVAERIAHAVSGTEYVCTCITIMLYVVIALMWIAGMFADDDSDDGGCDGQC